MKRRLSLLLVLAAFLPACDEPQLPAGRKHILERVLVELDGGNPGSATEILDRMEPGHHADPAFNVLMERARRDAAAVSSVVHDGAGITSLIASKAGTEFVLMSDRDIFWCTADGVVHPVGIARGQLSAATLPGDSLVLGLHDGRLVSLRPTEGIVAEESLPSAARLLCAAGPHVYSISQRRVLAQHEASSLRISAKMVLPWSPLGVQCLAGGTGVVVWTRGVVCVASPTLGRLKELWSLGDDVFTFVGADEDGAVIAATEAGKLMRSDRESYVEAHGGVRGGVLRGDTLLLVGNRGTSLWRSGSLSMVAWLGVLENPVVAANEEWTVVLGDGMAEWYGTAGILRVPPFGDPPVLPPSYRLGIRGGTTEADVLRDGSVVVLREGVASVLHMPAGVVLGDAVHSYETESPGLRLVVQENGTLQCLTLDSGTLGPELLASHRIQDATYSEELDKIAVVGEGLLTVWDGTSGAVVFQITCCAGGRSVIRARGDGFLVGTSEGSVLWFSAARRVGVHVCSMGAPVVSLSEQGEYVVAASEDGHVVCCQVSGGEPAWEHSLGSVHGVSCSGAHVLVTLGKGALLVRLTDGRVVRTLLDAHSVQDGRWSPDGGSIALVADKRLFLHEIASGRTRAIGDMIVGDEVAWHPSGRLLATWGPGHDIVVHDLSSGLRLCTFQVGGGAQGVAFSASGSHMYAVTSGGLLGWQVL